LGGIVAYELHIAIHLPGEIFMINLTINGQEKAVEVDPATPILWVVRENLEMNGTKFGCGIAQCGACTVHLDGQPVRSCSTPISQAEGKSIPKLEGIADEEGTLSKVQQAWIDVQVPQCGYCQSGQLMSATVLLTTTPSPTDATDRRGYGRKRLSLRHVWPDSSSHQDRRGH